MKKGFAIILAAATTAAFAVPAAAQDNPAFTGPRVEALVGYDWVRPGSTVDIDNNDDVNQTIDNITYGVGAGYDFSTGGAVFGVEGEYMWSEAKSRYSTANFTGYGIDEVSARNDLYVGARAGILASPSMLVYVKGGYTNARLSVVTTDNLTNVADKAHLDGWRVGAGVEKAFGNNLFVKGEYRYSNYEKAKFEAPSGLQSDRFDVDLDRHQLVVGVGYRF